MHISSRDYTSKILFLANAHLNAPFTGLRQQMFFSYHSFCASMHHTQ